jgi:hypothetical protein
VLLVVSLASVHGDLSELRLEHVRLANLKPSVAPSCLPLARGALRTLKCLYRARLVRSVFGRPAPLPAALASAVVIEPPTMAAREGSVKIKLADHLDSRPLLPVAAPPVGHAATMLVSPRQALEWLQAAWTEVPPAVLTDAWSALRERLRDLRSRSSPHGLREPDAAAAAALSQAEEGLQKLLTEWQSLKGAQVESAAQYVACDDGVNAAEAHEMVSTGLGVTRRVLTRLRAGAHAHRQRAAVRPAAGARSHRRAPPRWTPRFTRAHRAALEPGVQHGVGQRAHVHL